MNKKRLKSIIEETFDCKLKNFQLSTQLKKIPNWDSFNHINLMVAIENEFDIEINPKEVEKILKISDIIDLLKIKSKQ
jgi:acyl carrier protein